MRSRTAHSSAFGDGDHRTALVMAAVRTRTMRKPVLVAVLALRKPGVRERIVAPPLVASLLGVPTFGIGHLRVSFAAIVLRPRAARGSDDPHAGLSGAAARAAVQVLTAGRAQSLAVLPAHGLERELQVDLLACDGGEIHLA